MPGPRRRLVALITSGVTLALTAGLGSPLAGDHLSGHRNALLASLMDGLRYPRWSLRPASSMLDPILSWITPMVADVLLAALVGLLSAVIVGNRTRFPALLAGWGAVMVLAAAAGAGRAFTVAAFSHSGPAVYGLAVTAITTGLWFGLATGWLIGVIVACAVSKNVTDEEADDDEDENPVTGVRIWSPSQPDWQETQDLPAQNLRPAGAQPTTAQPTITQPATARPTVIQPATAHPTAAQPTTAQPWPPASPPSAT
jgi:hypothetical protein